MSWHGDSETGRNDSSTDSDTNFKETTDFDTAEASIMPNGQAFYNRVEETFDIQGAWYWFDDGRPNSTVQRVTAIMPKDTDSDSDSDGTQAEHNWFNGTTSNIDFSSKATAEKICIEGDVLDYMALGFEICSTQSDEEPYEFPATMWICDRLSHGKGLARFRGIRFDLDIGISEFSKIDVEFKEWGRSIDEYQPKCTIVGGAAGTIETSSKCRAEEIQETGGTRIRAEAMGAKSLDTENEELNLSMLQAIHVKVYKNDQELFKYCLSNAYAFGFGIKSTKTNDSKEPEIVGDDCEEGIIGEPLRDSDTEWDSLNIRWKKVDGADTDSETDSGFEIMTTETTVGQYKLCKDHGACSSIKYNWESCNASESGENIKNSEWSQKAVNCVNWCQAGNFCRWVGGRLPTGTEWSDAALRYGMRILKCDSIVMNELNNGVGCGDRMPATVCSKEPNADTDTDVVCDMLGNLWEWVDDNIDNQYDPWATGYKRIIGGSLNSIDSTTLTSDASTIEHPVVPHSPTRLGFRCVRDVNK
jgi:hypothetical protein